MQSYRGVVALDGPSGTGKSTVARKLAQRLGARYLDTGAMYRAATLAVLRAGADPNDPDAVAKVVAQCDIAVSTDPVRPAVTARRRARRRPDPRRRRHPGGQRRLSRAAGAHATGRSAAGSDRRRVIVVEGRDIGSVVWPQAESRVYLTASAETRARRRAGDMGPTTDVTAVAADIDRRDRLDSARAVSPLRKPDGAIELDTTELDIDKVVERLVDIVLGQRVHGD